MYLPPVNLPDLANHDYARDLYAMTAGVGDAWYGAKRDKIGDAQWQQEQDRLSAAQALAQSNADRNYALELQKFNWDQQSGTDRFGSLIYEKMPDGSIRASQLTKQGDPIPLPNQNLVFPMDPTDLGNQVIYPDKYGRPVLPPSVKGGTPPAGFVPDGQNAGGQTTYGPMSGTPQEREYSQAQTQARSRLNSVATQAEVVTQEIDHAIGIVDQGWSTGTLGAVMGGVGAVAPTSRGELMNSLATIKGNISFDKLQQMREMSPTGGALGQVSDFENRLLQATAGPIDPMNAGQMKETLINIKDRYEDAVVAHQIAYLTDFEGLPRDVADQAIQAIREGKDPQAVMQRVNEVMGGQ